MVTSDLSRYFANIGRKGGRKSRRVLTPEQARQMVAVRLARQAFDKYRTQCFWSHKDVAISSANVLWVAEQLGRNGDRSAWQQAAKIRALCR